MGRTLLLAALFAASAVAAAPPITKIESRTLPEKVVVRRVFDQVAELLATNRGSETDAKRAAALLALAKIDAYDPDVITPKMAAAMSPHEIERLVGRLAEIVTIWPDPYHRKHPRFPLRQITFETKPRASSAPGVCVTYSITTNFRTVDNGSSARAKTRVEEVLTDNTYYFPVPPPSATLEPASYGDRKDTGRVCAALDRDKSAWFQASDVGSAVKAAWLLQSVSAAIKNNTSAPFSLVCEDQTKPCRPAILEVVESNGWWVDDCGAVHCKLDAGGAVLDIWHQKDAPQYITKVDIHWTIIIADPLAD